MHVTAHVTTGFQQLAFADRTAHYEGFVHAHEPFDPRIDEQIVADGNLYRIRKPGLDEPHVEEGGIEDYVAVIGNKGVACRVAWGWHCGRK